MSTSLLVFLLQIQFQISNFKMTIEAVLASGMSLSLSTEHWSFFERLCQMSH